MYRLPTSLAAKLKFFVALPSANFTSLADSGGVAVRHVKPLVSSDFLLVAVHLPSKLYLEASDQAQLAARVAKIVSEAERRIGHDRTVVIGDLNMNPFEDGMVGSEGLHAVMARSVAAKGDRVVHGEKRAFFYNPMWSYLGDDSEGPPGTFYRTASKPITYHWNMFDQVLLRPSLLSTYVPGDVRILTKAGGISLLTAAGIPQKAISDHLPLMACIASEEESNGIEKSLGTASGS